jgi:hypothetical protein
VLGDVVGVTDPVVYHVRVRVCDFSMRCCGVCGVCREVLLEVECQRVLSESCLVDIALRPIGNDEASASRSYSYMQRRSGHWEMSCSKLFDKLLIYKGEVALIEHYARRVNTHGQG